MDTYTRFDLEDNWRRIGTPRTIDEGRAIVVDNITRKLMYIQIAKTKDGLILPTDTLEAILTKDEVRELIEELKKRVGDDLP